MAFGCCVLGMWLKETHMCKGRLVIALVDIEINQWCNLLYGR